LDGCQGFGPRLAQLLAENMGLLTDILLRPPCLSVGGGECGPCPIFALYTLTFTVKLRKNHGKSSIRVKSLKTKCKLINLKIPFIPHIEHVSSRL
jgi:hypothetical protein